MTLRQSTTWRTTSCSWWSQFAASFYISVCSRKWKRGSTEWCTLWCTPKTTTKFWSQWWSAWWKLSSNSSWSWCASPWWLSQTTCMRQSWTSLLWASYQISMKGTLIQSTTLWKSRWLGRNFSFPLRLRKRKILTGRKTQLWGSAICAGYAWELPISCTRYFIFTWCHIWFISSWFSKGLFKIIISD